MTAILPQVGRKEDRKSTRLNSSHGSTSYAVFCLQNKKAPGVLNVQRYRMVQHVEGGSVPSLFDIPFPKPRVGGLMAGIYFDGSPTTEICTLSLHDALPI